MQHQQVPQQQQQLHLNWPSLQPRCSGHRLQCQQLQALLPLLLLLLVLPSQQEPPPPPPQQQQQEGQQSPPLLTLLPAELGLEAALA
jgi:hypothetical protein